MTQPCIYPDLKQMLKELAEDLKDSMRQEMKLLEANIKNKHIEAINDVERKQDLQDQLVKEHELKITKLFTIVDQIRESYQQAVGAFKLWGFIIGFGGLLSAGAAIYQAIK